MPFNVDMTVEIPLNSNVKYEYDEKTECMRCDRIMTTSMLYPGNYGYVKYTLSGDMDPIDVLLVCDYAIYPGTVVNVKVIGVLLTEDEHGSDEKLIAVPSSDVDRSYDDVNDYTDLGHKTKMIQHFFEHYKDNEPNKWVNVVGLENAAKAYELLDLSIDRYITHIYRNKIIPTSKMTKLSEYKRLLNFKCGADMGNLYIE